ncbi:metallophosphatase family protein [Halorussus gelatinilyticus]|uniref:Phosphoesterase n=1 Tax=Halorussus gelatinilyticus TaxID=2937524 RepID=A0A8U0INI5_9EURY|nr:metallophosphoesterase family protein [Halorussus gelatinilyticus]UPW02195.1 metallophosphatase family protein [Halorussus gelatinilyticus]
MVEIAIVSDTHVPSRADRIPEWVADRVRDADYTVHAGDFDSPAAYETVADLAGENFTAVAGNMDPGSLDLPKVATVEVSGTTFVVTHGTAATEEEYEATVAEAVSEELTGPGIAVAGHTHALVDDDIEGIRFLNPGSATGADPANVATMLTVEILEGDVSVEAYVEDERVEEFEEYPER